MAIHSPDALTRAGLASHLQHDRRFCETSADRADVTVVVVDTANAATLSLLHSLSASSQARFALLVGRQWQADIFAAVDRGVRAVLWRDSFTPAAFFQALLTVARGGGSFPPALQGTLMRQVQWTHHEVLTPRGLTASGVSPREVDVLRLIAEGLELSEIAEKLAYSERTVKYVLYGLMKRLNLRNRAHAVSYALRTGLI
ncbi:response regulator transcription factor [Streptomyces lydicus]|uniref:response regulator transcription factor n=1 Tax=Streptomyces lydicus TaxID=47763 RepID=UPI00368CFC27